MRWNRIHSLSIRYFNSFNNFNTCVYETLSAKTAAVKISMKSKEAKFLTSVQFKWLWSLVPVSPSTVVSSQQTPSLHLRSRLLRLFLCYHRNSTSLTFHVWTVLILSWGIMLIPGNLMELNFVTQDVLMPSGTNALFLATFAAWLRGLRSNTVVKTLSTMGWIGMKFGSEALVFIWLVFECHQEVKIYTCPSLDRVWPLKTKRHTNIAFCQCLMALE